MATSIRDALSPADVVELYSRLWIPQVHYIGLGSITLITYEHLITAHQEYQVIWRRKVRLPTVLFVVNRFVLQAIAVLYLLAHFKWWHDYLSCKVLSRMLGVLSVVLDLVILVFLSVRIHAINDRRWGWTLAVFLLGFVATPPTLVGVATDNIATSIPEVAMGCYPALGALGPDPDSWYKLLLAVRVCVIVQNVIVLGITWYRTIGIVAAARSANIKASVGSVLLRDGTMYFLTTLGINVAGIVTLMVGFTSLSMQANILNAVTMSRFILNLRIASSGNDSSEQSISLPRYIDSIRISSGSVLDHPSITLILRRSGAGDFGRKHERPANKHVKLWQHARF